MVGKSNTAKKKNNTPKTKPGEVASGTDDAKTCAMLTYVVLGILWYFLNDDMKKNDYVKFHAKQALLLFAIAISVNIFVGIIFSFIGSFTLMPIFSLLFIVFAIIGIINAGSNKKEPLPLIGSLAEKIFTF